MMPEELRIKMVTAASTNLKEETTDDFERRIKVAELALKEKEIDSNERIVQQQMLEKQMEKKLDSDFMKAVGE
jgi:hypothetical protein